MTQQLHELIEIKGIITLLSGLHIGASDTEMKIGGIDSPVVKHPYTNQPYIPGSSLKGKMRSLLEWRAGVATLNAGKPASYSMIKESKFALTNIQKTEVEYIVKLFGGSGDEKNTNIGPTRLSFWDCPIDSKWLENRKDFVLFEEKTENVIDRVTGTAKHPRRIERVPADVQFSFKVIIKCLELQEKDVLLPYFLKGLKLLEMDSLGGSGSRGYGKIQFHLENDLQQILEKIDPFEEITEVEQ